MSLDWNKAFDRVDIEFLLKVMTAFAFGGNFVALVKMLFTGICSRMCINHIMGNSINVERSVRQGCPLSMILYVIHQEPLYRLIRKSKVKSIKLPRQVSVGVVGYADDTNIIKQRIVSLKPSQ
ncbi:uncharacterized protein [Palaemon carinicauda]|uniref:uncharacterized protein n=1 Tax=Palaemon carinicauda TaxID=392227 RepID=UPI0035B5FC71